MAYRNGVWQRGTSNGNDRGNTASRRARKLWLIETFGWPDLQDPLRGLVCCYLCAVPLLYEDLTVDRIIPKCLGGTYARGNIRPACGPDNSETGGRLAHRNR